MVSSSKPHEKEYTFPTNSPSSNISSSSNHSNGGAQIQNPPTPKPITRSESNPYPTTFVQADTSSFKQVVQMLTGSTETAKQASKPIPDPPSRNFIIPPKKQGFKLYERRNQLKNGLIISPMVPQNSGFSPRNNNKPEILSPSLLNFPSLVLSPVTPLIEDPFNKSSPSVGSLSEEEKAVMEKKFYLHPSPRSTPRDSEPQLLPLFPLSSSQSSS